MTAKAIARVQRRADTIPDLLVFDVVAQVMEEMCPGVGHTEDLERMDNYLAYQARTLKLFRERTCFRDESIFEHAMKRCLERKVLRMGNGWPLYEAPAEGRHIAMTRVTGATARGILDEIEEEEMAGQA